MSSHIVNPLINQNPTQRPTAEQVVKSLDNMIRQTVLTVYRTALPVSESENIIEAELDTNLLHLYHSLLLKPPTEVDAIIEQAMSEIKKRAEEERVKVEEDKKKPRKKSSTHGKNPSKRLSTEIIDLGHKVKTKIKKKDKETKEKEKHDHHDEKETKKKEKEKEKHDHHEEKETKKKDKETKEKEKHDHHEDKEAKKKSKKKKDEDLKNSLPDPIHTDEDLATLDEETYKMDSKQNKPKSKSIFRFSPKKKDQERLHSHEQPIR